MPPSERARARVLAFSLKESIYKAHAPCDQAALTYRDASIAFDDAGAPSVTMRAPFDSQMDIWSERHGSRVITAVRRSLSTR
jgi:4'-phosphopantetheinyl transferase EntD